MWTFGQITHQVSDTMPGTIFISAKTEIKTLREADAVSVPTPARFHVSLCIRMMNLPTFYLIRLKFLSVDVEVPG